MERSGQDQNEVRQEKFKARSRQSQVKGKVRSREGQGNLKVMSRQGKTKVKVISSCEKKILTKGVNKKCYPQ